MTSKIYIAGNQTWSNNWKCCDWNWMKCKRNWAKLMLPFLQTVQNHWKHQNQQQFNQLMYVFDKTNINSSAYFLTCTFIWKQAKHLSSIVLHVPPTKIPFSLLGIQRLWANRLNLIVDFFTHSTILELTPAHKAFANALTSFKVNANVPTLNVSIIWKDTLNTSLVGLPGTFIPITGEVNVLRYLMRVGPNEFGYSNVKNNLEVDTVFDLLYELALTSSKDHRSSILKRLSQRLAKKSSFAVGLPNVCDIGVLSIVKQSIKNDGELPANIKVWYQASQQILCH